MYHPVEKPAFDAAGDPVLDLTEDVHEFIELKNAGATPVTLDGWRLRGGIEFDFPAGTAIPAGAYVVVARHPDRLEAVAAYGLPAGSVLGPWRGGLSNRGDTVHLETLAGQVADSVSYSSEAPWPIGANAFGAESDWTGIDESQHQYRGRSLERVTIAWPSNDPANWLASPVAGGPSPGRANATVLTAPRPVAVSVTAVQETTGSIMIRPGEPVQVEALFSSGGAGMNAVRVEYFIDDRNSTTEEKSMIEMAPVAGQPGRWRAQVAGQSGRALVRYRVLADRGQGMETVAPRADDPFGWYGWFVTPVRSGTRPPYDIFISSASLSTLSANINGSPRRIMNPDPPGLPRPAWSATQPAVLVRDGRVIDVRMRHHGSRYNRNTFRASFKVQFPRYARLDDMEALFLKDKGDDHRVGSALYRAAGLPSFTSRYVDLYLNTNTVLQRLEVPEMDDRHFERFALAEALRNPGTEVEKTGEFYKATGVVPFETGAGIGATSVYTSSGEGPYYIGNCAPIPAKAGWSPRQRYDFTYGGQMHTWIGGRDTEAMITGMWAARGDSPTSPNPDGPALRAWLEANFDVDATLKYIAIRNWCAPFDNATHNYFLWRRANGRWAMLPWDLDGELGDSAKSIYWDEQAVPQPDTLRGPQWIKDSFLKAFREEYKRTLWLLNNTVLLPANFGASGFGGSQSFATARHTNVNAQLGFGPFYRPVTPAPTAPAAGGSVLPGARLEVAAYTHGSPAPAPDHASTTWTIRAAGGSWDAPLVKTTSQSALTSWPIPFEALEFGGTYFWKCLFTDADGHPSFESPERSFVFGVPSGGAPELRLNEIFARGTGPDFIELHNTGTTAAELAGYSLSDDPALPGQHVFPIGTVLAAGGFLVVTLDDNAAFRLSGDGQTVVLLRPDGNAVDAVAFGPQAADRSIGRSSDDAWSLGAPTPGAANLTESIGPATGLRFNEWMASNPDGADWFELVNTSGQPASLSGLKLSNGADTTILPALSFIGAGGFQQIIADREDGPHHVDFKLSSSGESLTLADTNGVAIDAIQFGPQEGGISEGRLPDGSGTIIRFGHNPTPGEANALAIDGVRVSRIYPDIELYNSGPTDIVIDGWSLSDAPGSTSAFVLPNGFGAVPAGGTRLVPAASLPFGLDRLRGGEVVLEHSGTHRSRQRYGAWDGHPWGLVGRAAGDVFVPVHESPATPANTPVVGPVVISEVNYHPPDLPGDNDDYEFVEWQNTGAGPVDVSEWRLGGDASFTMPAGTVMPAGGRLVIAAVNPAEHAARYEVPAGTPVFGPWSGGLPNSGGRVRLVRLLPPVTDIGPDFGYRPEIVQEDVAYDDVAPWPEAADGGGPALGRSATAGFAGDASSWSADTPSPGASPSPNQSPTVTINSPADGSAWATGSSITVSASAADPDGAVRRVVLEADGIEVADDTVPPYEFAWSSAVAGPHLLRVIAVDGRLARATAEISLTLSNEPPRSALTAPDNASRFVEGQSVDLQAVAEDPEARLDRVEFLIDGTVVATASSAPWHATWTAGPPGLHTLRARAVDTSGLSGVSQPVQCAVVPSGGASAGAVIAYRVPVGTTGNQSYNGSLGHDFEVVSPVVVTRLGVFDSGANGLNATLVAQIWSAGASPRLLVSQSFTSGSPGELAPGTSNRFKSLATPLVLNPGSYTSVAYGYGATELNGNSSGNTPTWTTDTGGGLLRFTGSSRYGTAAQYPATADGGPVNRYAGPTFEFTNADADGDFMPLDWELAHGFDPADPSDGADDDDGDGVSNREEFAAGTDPALAASRPGLDIAAVTSDEITVRFALPANRSAILQRSTDLTYWTDTQSIPATTSPRTLDLPVPLTPPIFVRVVVRP